ncbi:MAG: CYTH domain-containing protein [Kiritimatiellales bacterium]|nr:CYTH domain-containing protein [Kiritimatiellota bacterium]MBL7011341.1 CYTH domain-containing protein [Kiritimatiellales bacterium]
MKMEIERKFRVVGDEWRVIADAGLRCEQGYILSGPDQITVRVRRIGDKGFLTLKGVAEGISRPELEYEVPVAEAEYMLENFCADQIVSKTRFLVGIGGFTWEIDEFLGQNQGLVLAEIELESEDQVFPVPDWLGEDVSFDFRYTNASLAAHPFAEWKNSSKSS